MVHGVLSIGIAQGNCPRAGDDLTAYRIQETAADLSLITSACTTSEALRRLLCAATVVGKGRLRFSPAVPGFSWGRALASAGSGMVGRRWGIERER